MIRLHRVWKEYGEHIVLEDVQAEVEDGEFVTIVGASGCGKTTFLRMLLGVDRPSRGAILLDGQPIPEEPDEHRGIVFQRYSVFPHLNVLKNVMIGEELAQSKVLGRLFGKKRREARTRAEDMLASVGLADAMYKYPDELSGGMQQRLAIAQALIRKPRILLLDEPFGALDPGIRKDMHELTLELWKTHGLTIFMITHDIQEGFKLGTRLWVFDKLRNDPHQPNRYGAGITYDLRLKDSCPAVKAEITRKLTTAETAA